VGRPKTAPSPQRQRARGAHQNIARAASILSALAEGSAAGLRVVDVIRATGLGKASAHRALAGLVAHGLAEQDPATGRFFLGMDLLRWAVSAADRFDLPRLVEPALARLCELTQDTVYLTARTGDEAVCVYRREGAFPVKVLTLDVGDRRPLGVGTGSLALLAFLPDAEVARIMKEQARARAPYNFDDATLRRLIAEARRGGYAFNDIHIRPNMAAIQGMSGIALPIRRPDGTPICAVSVVAITARMRPPRRESIVASLREEVQRLEAELQPVLAQARVALGPYTGAGRSA
jgi:DNA-binding IclR family transcriptional regulator